MTQPSHDDGILKMLTGIKERLSYYAG